MPGKFTRAAVAVRSPIRTVSPEADTMTHEGGAGWTRDPKSELFLLAITNMVGEQTFYESASDRDSRFRSLIGQVAADDPEWVARFIPYLRNTMNLRSASIVMAAELVRANLKAGRPGNRAIVASALMRADEPAELIAYWRATNGRSIPMPVKRGIADAVNRLYNENAALKYDGKAGTIRMADVLDITHPKPKAEWQASLFKYLLDKRHNREDADASALATIANRLRYEGMTSEEFREAWPTMEHAGFTWEWASTKYGALDAAFWQALIPHMGYMALLRNLRNFDETSVAADVKASVVARLADSEQVRKSRQLPLRFYSAWKAARSLSWAGALESALNISVENVPSLSGRTLVMVDTSGSMNSGISDRSKALRWELAALFGAALALRAENADLISFQSDSRVHRVHRGDSVLRTVDAIGSHVGGGTNTWQAFSQHYSGHDRVVILTDEQAFPVSGYAYGPSVGGLPNVPIYTFNLAGYKAAHAPSGDRRFTFGGLNDQGFLAIALLERGGATDWPF